MIAYIIIGIIVLCILLKRHFSYWSRVGLENYNSFMKSIGPNVWNAYYHFKHKGVKHGGTFVFLKSVYIPVDLDVLKNIMQNDFNHFVNRGIFKDPPPLLRHLVNMEDEEWRTWRSKLTPTFTSGKMKMMFHTMMEKAAILENAFNDYSVLNEAIDIKEVFSRYTTDVIGSTVFGIECNSLKNPNAEFRKFGKRILDRVKFILVLAQLPQPLLKLLRVRYIPEDLESFFTNVIKDSIHYRESKHIFRKDFLQLLLQLKNEGKVAGGEDECPNNDKMNPVRNLTLEQITAQCLVFFGAGFETSSITLSFAMLELGGNQEIQDELRKNIRDVLKDYGGEITYDAIMKMEYLDKVVQETLRKHPPVQLFPRVCNKDYHVPETNFVIKKGQQIFLPFRAIHYDPEHWPDPQKFDPDRFSEENKAKRHRFAYMPFGEGPRMCIGSRFGLLQTKIGIASVIKNFRVSLNNKTHLPIKIDYRSFLINIQDDLWMNIEKVN